MSRHILSNLPSPVAKSSAIVGKVEGGSIVIRNADGWEVFRVNRGYADQVDTYMANEIASAITRARNTGFEQGRAYIRKAIGGILEQE